MENFKKCKGLNILEYLLLKWLVDNNDFFNEWEGQRNDCMSILKNLEMKDYLRLVNGDIILSEKALSIFSSKKDNDKFNEFWELYHELTTLPKTDKEAAIKKWKALTFKEKDLALNREIIEKYCFNNNPKYRKKARTYLNDKNFNDEYEVEDKWTQMK